MTKVFLDYDQKALDDAYDQAVYAANRDQVIARFASSSRIARQRVGEPQRFCDGLDTELVTVIRYQAHLRGGDFPVDALRSFECDE